MLTPGFSIGLLGVLVLFHAAFSTIQSRSPQDHRGRVRRAASECAVGVGGGVCAVYVTVPGKFKSIHPDSEENRSTTFQPQPSDSDLMDEVAS
ncbi:Membrane magnesium transporter-like protein [Drosera capensis]